MATIDLDYAWWESQVNSLPHTWAGSNKFPRGTVHIPPLAYLRTKGGIKMPCRVCMEGGERHVYGMPGIVAESGFVGRWLVEVKKGKSNKNNWNSNFGTWVRNISINCVNRCDGLLFGGAQSSGVHNVRISHAKTVGLWVGKSTSRAEFGALDIIGHDKSANQRGTAVRWDRAFGCCVGSIHTHRCKVGMHFESAHSIVVNAHVSEHTDKPLVIGGRSSNIHVRGDWSDVGEIAIDLTGCGSDVEIRGAIRKAKVTTVYYLDRQGTKRVLVTRADGQARRVFGINSDDQLDA